MPLSSLCHNGCIFCSHKNMAADDYLRRFYGYQRDIKEVIEHIEFLDTSKKVYIGESATKVFEGEPFLYDGIYDVLKALRKHIKKPAICITTCGGHIKSDFYKIAESIGPLEINFSLNSYNAQTRDRIVFDKMTSAVFANLEKIAAIGPAVRLNVSLMAVNESLTPSEYILDDIARLQACGRIFTIKIFLPRFAKNRFGLFFNSYEEFNDYCCRLKNMLKLINQPGLTPVILEPLPPEFLNGDIVIHSVVPNTKAHALGLSRGDRLISINGTKPLSKVDAHRSILDSYGTVKLEVIKKQSLHDQPVEAVTIEKYNPDVDGAGGIIFTADMPPEALKALIEIDKKLRHKNQRGLIATTKLSIEYLNSILKKFNIENLTAVAINNSYFGGSIDCAGLLTLADIRNQISDSMKCGEDKNMPAAKNDFNILILPGIMFDHLGCDLNGECLYEFKAAIDFDVITI